MSQVSEGTTPNPPLHPLGRSFPHLDTHSTSWKARSSDLHPSACVSLPSLQEPRRHIRSSCERGLELELKLGLLFPNHLALSRLERPSMSVENASALSSVCAGATTMLKFTVCLWSWCLIRITKAATAY